MPDADKESLMHGLGERDGHVGVGGRLAGRLRRLPFQLDEPFGAGVRLGGAQPG